VDTDYESPKYRKLSAGYANERRDTLF